MTGNKKGNKMKLFRIISLLIAVMMLTLVFASCDNGSGNTDDTSAAAQDTSADVSDTTSDQQQGTTEETTGADAKDTVDYELIFVDSNCKYSDASAQKIEGNTITLVKPGNYKLSGTLSDGTIVVDVQKTEKVTLMLDNFTASCSTSAVIYVKSADKVYLDLQKGTTNTLTDASTYKYASATETKPNACVYSSDDLTIKGGGTLVINANYNNGIGCKNDIEIKNGHVIVTAVKNAIKGNDSVTVKGDAEVIIKGCEDGIKTDSLDEGKGFIVITEEAQVNITCNDDALQASQSITVTTGVTVLVSAGGDITNCDGQLNIDDGTIVTK